MMTEAATSGRYSSANSRNSILLVALALLVLLHSSTRWQYLKQSFAGGTVAFESLRRTPRRGDGCYHVFLDVGANIGVHGRFLLEPHKYPDSDHSVALFEEKFGKDRNNEDFCVFEIEANPNRWPKLQENSLAYAKMGWRYHVIQAAAGDYAGTMDFIHQNDAEYNEWGFSAVKDWTDGKGKLEHVPVIHLAEWLQHEIYERQIPHIENHTSPIVGMKMDIEGSEYVVLPDLMLSGAFCKLDFSFGEFHPNFAPMEFKNSTLDLSTEQESIKTMKAYLKVLEASRNCKVEFLDIDDESYLYDGQPLPEPPAQKKD